MAAPPGGPWEKAAWVQSALENPGLAYRWVSGIELLASADASGPPDGAVVGPDRLAALPEAGELVAIPTRAAANYDGNVTDCRVIQDTNGDGQLDSNDSCIPIGGFINISTPAQSRRATWRSVGTTGAFVSCVRRTARAAHSRASNWAAARSSSRTKIRKFTKILKPQ